MYLADGIAGLFGASAALIALREVEKNGGRGQVIDLPLLDPLFAMLGPQAAAYRLTGKLKPRTGSRSTNTAPRNAYRCRDGLYVALSASTQKMAERTLRASGGRADRRPALPHQHRAGEERRRPRRHHRRLRRAAQQAETSRSSRKPRSPSGRSTTSRRSSRTRISSSARSSRLPRRGHGRLPDAPRGAAPAGHARGVIQLMVFFFIETQFRKQFAVVLPQARRRAADRPGVPSRRGTTWCIGRRPCPRRGSRRGSRARRNAGLDDLRDVVDRPMVTSAFSKNATFSAWLRCATKAPMMASRSAAFFTRSVVGAVARVFDQLGPPDRAQGRSAIFCVEADSAT